MGEVGAQLIFGSLINKMSYLPFHVKFVLLTPMEGQRLYRHAHTMVKCA